MSRPAEFNIIADRNVTMDYDIVHTESDGSAFDLTGYTPTADAVGAILPSGRLELSPTVTDAAGGVINITLSKAATGALVSTEGLKPSEMPKWDLLIDTGGVTTKVAYGILTIVDTQTT